MQTQASHARRNPTWGYGKWQTTGGNATARTTAPMAFLTKDAAIDRLAELYRAAGRWIEPRELDRQGGEAALIRESLWRHGLLWGAVKPMLLARHPDLLRQTGLVAVDGTVMSTPAEVRVLNAVLGMDPRPHVRTNVKLGDRAAYETDLLVDGRVIVEVAMVAADAIKDDWLRAQYRERLSWKLHFYKWALHRMPVIFWADDVADDRRLASRVSDIAEILRAAPPRLMEVT